MQRCSKKTLREVFPEEREKLGKLPPLKYFLKHSIPCSERGRGLFKVGDVIERGEEWLAVVEVVPYGMYPGKWPGLRVKGYYREMESYIVLDNKGRYRWPWIKYLLEFKSKVR